jgi:hypothetical protein
MSPSLFRVGHPVRRTRSDSAKTARAQFEKPEAQLTLFGLHLSDLWSWFKYQAEILKAAAQLAV